MVKVEYFTTTQINALPTTPGRLVFDTDIGKLKINDGSFYKIITDAAATVNTAGNVGINTTALDYALEVNSSIGSNLRLTYNSNSGNATNYCNLFTTSTGNLTITPSGGFVNITTHNGINQGLSLNGTLVTADAGQLNFLSGVTAGTAANSKALVLNASGNIGTINSLTATSITGTLQTPAQPYITSIGNLSSLTVTGTLTTTGLTLNGGSVTASASDINQLTGLSPGTVTTSKVVIVDSNKDISGFRNITVTGSVTGVTTLSTTNFTLNGTSVTASAAQLNFLSGVAAGTAANSKALVLDSSGNIATITSLTATSITGTLQTPAQPLITSVGTLTSATVSGTTSTTGLTLNGISITATGTQLNYLSGVFPGTVLASKAVVVDANKDITSIRNITTVLGTISGLLNVNTISLSLNNVAVDAIATEINRLAGLTLGITSASKVLTVDQFLNITGINSLTSTFLTGTINTNSQPNITTVGTLGSLTVSGNVYLTGHNGSSVGLVLSGVLVISTASELNYVAGVTAGTVLASKALVVDSNKDLSSLRNLTLTGILSTTSLTLNSVSVTASASELNYNALVTAGTVLASKTLVVDSNKDLASLRNLTLTGTLSTTSLTLDNISVTATASEINTLAGITPGVVTASKLLVVDSNKDLESLRNLSLTKLNINGGTSGIVSIISTTGTWTLSLPTNAGTNGYALQTDGNGNTFWAVAGSSLPDITDVSGVSLTLTPTTYATSISNACLIVNGGAGIAKNIKIGGQSLTLSSWLTNGCQYDSIATTFTDSGAIGTRASAVISSFGVPTLASTNAVTITNSATVYIADAPTAGSNMTLTNKYALWIPLGNVLMGAGTASTTTTTGTLVITGGLGVSGQVTATNLSGTLTTAAQTGITSVGTLTGLTMGGTLAMGTNNITGTGTIGGTLTTAVQTGITSVGTLTGLTMGGALAMGTNNITGTGTIEGTLTTAAQTNITSVGTLTSPLKTLNTGSNSLAIESSNTTQLTNSSNTDQYDLYIKRNTLSAGDTTGIAFLHTSNNPASTVASASIIVSRVALSSAHFIINTTQVERFRIASDGIITISNTTASTSNISSSLLLSGGISINNSTDAVSSTNGGTFTSAGGGAFAKSLYVGTTLTANTLTGTLSTAAQTNITSIGTLTGLTMGGTLAMGTNNITGTGTIGGTLTTAAQPNITSVGTLAQTVSILKQGQAINISDGTITLVAYINVLSLSTAYWGTSTNHGLSLQTNSAERIHIDTSGNTNIVYHNGSTIGLKLGGTLVTTTADQLNFLSGVTAGTAANSKALVLDSSGNIATINSLTASSLTVSTTGGNLLTLTSSSSSSINCIKFNTNSQNWELGARGSASAPNSSFYLFDSNAATMRINILPTTGFVGIGSSVPNRQFTINNSSGNCLRLVYNDSSGTESSYCDQLVASTGTTTFVTAGTTGDIRLTPLSGKVSFGTSAGANLSNITNDSSGNLSINGVTANVRINNNLIVGNTAAGPNILYFNGVTGDTPTNYSVIAERLYGAGDISELLLFKGNDVGVSGPDRIRLRAAEIRFQVYQSTEDFTGLLDNNTFVTLTANGSFQVGSAVTATSWGTTGIQYAGNAVTYTVNGSPTTTTAAINSYGACTITGTTAGTITNAATIYIGGPPTQGGSVTISSPWSLYSNSGKVFLQNDSFQLNLKSTLNTGNAAILLSTDTTNWEVGARCSANPPNSAYYIYNGAYRFVIDSNGNIGLKGQTTQTAILDFGNNATNTSLFIYNNTTSAFGFGANDNFLKYYSGVSSGHVWYVDSSAATPVGSEAMRITSGRTLLIGKTAAGNGSNWLEVGVASNYSASFDGRVGIGTTSPAYPLEITTAAGGAASYNYAALTGGTSTGWAASTSGGATTSNIIYPSTAGVTNTTPTNISLRTAGRILCGSELDIVSDIRVKENFKMLQLNYCKSFISDIIPFQFNYKINPCSITFGYKAQDLIKKNYGELVNVHKNDEMEKYLDEDNFESPPGWEYSITPNNITPILHVNIQNLYNQNEELKKENQELKDRILRIEQHLNLS